jgi:hypothetical protein
MEEPGEICPCVMVGNCQINALKIMFLDFSPSSVKYVAIRIISIFVTRRICGFLLIVFFVIDAMAGALTRNTI